MRKWTLLLLGCLGLCLTFVSCESKLDTQKCEELILAHPFFNCRHVGVTDHEYPDCKDAWVGSRENGYVRLSGPNVTAYYYDLYGFGIKNVHDLVIEDNRAVCKFDVVETDKTAACQYLQDNRIKGEKLACEALFVKYDDSGWKLEQIASGQRLFMINIWDNGAYKTMISFNSFK